MPTVENYTPFRVDFPGFALLDALAVIKDNAVNTPAGKLQLAHSAYDLVGWALHAMLESDKSLVGFAPDTAALTDDEAMALLEQREPAEGLQAFAYPISPTIALKLAAWLLKVAEIVLPALL